MKTLAVLRSLVIFFLFSILFSLSTSSASAATSAPLPCENPKSTEYLTDNYLVDKDGKPQAANLIFANQTATGTLHERVTVSGSFDYTVDFSTLQAIFGSTNSDYLEGKYQDPEHKTANITGLKPADFSKYHGAAEKTSPRATLDPLKVKYVQYVHTNNTLPEAADTFTDYNGNDPKTIDELVSAFQDPQPPSAGGDQNTWEQGWGKYWDKIPTAYNEFYEGQLEFRYTTSATSNYFMTNAQCPFRATDRLIKFVVPDFYRTTAVSDQLNRVVVPCAAQSFRQEQPVKEKCGPQSIASTQNINQNENVLSKAITFCKNLLRYPQSVVEKLKKSVSAIFEILKPIKTAYAAQDESASCVKIRSGQKEGSAPFCALPAGQLLSGESCTVARVVCTFHINWTADLYIGTSADQDNDGIPDGSFDSCSPAGGSQLTCSTTVYILPDFRIPFLAEIWNNALYSDQAEGGTVSDQITGRPGIYSFFTPRAVNQDDLAIAIKNCEAANFDPTNQACQAVIAIGDARITDLGQRNAFNECIMEAFINNGRAMTNCIINVARDLIKRPGQANQTSQTDLKQSFIGGTDCSKEFVWHNALYPLAAQKQYGITNQCPLTAVAQLPDTGSGPGPPGDNVPPNQNNCGGAYILDNPLGNFGDPNCGLPSEDDIFNEIARLDADNANLWMCIVTYESGFNPNAWLTGDPNEDFHSPDPDGAWGLFQMGRGKNGEFDHGDKIWYQQIANAISYNQVLGGDFVDDRGVSYWDPINQGLCP